jgi:indolepyruvate ferredoxin oxidoreductase beta subunit
VAIETMNFLIAGVGGQGTVLASSILAAVGLAAGYDVKKSDILGLAVRGGGVVGHVRWGKEVHSPIVPEGRADYLVAFEILECLRWLNQLRPEGTVLVNGQQIHPVTVSSGFATYPDRQTVDRALQAATPHVYRIPGLDMAQQLGHPRVLNVVLLGGLSALLSVEPGIWESVLKDRVPPNYRDLNLHAFHKGRAWIQERKSCT